MCLGRPAPTHKDISAALSSQRTALCPNLGIQPRGCLLVSRDPKCNKGRTCHRKLAATSPLLDFHLLGSNSTAWQRGSVTRLGQSDLTAQHKVTKVTCLGRVCIRLIQTLHQTPQRSEAGCMLSYQPRVDQALALLFI